MGLCAAAHEKIEYVQWVSSVFAYTQTDGPTTKT